PVTSLCPARLNHTHCLLEHRLKDHTTHTHTHTHTQTHSTHKTHTKHTQPPYPQAWHTTDVPLAYSTHHSRNTHRQLSLNPTMPPAGLTTHTHTHTHLHPFQIVPASMHDLYCKHTTQ